MAESKRSEQPGEKYEPPRAVKLSDAAAGTATAGHCASLGNTPGWDCLSGHGVFMFRECLTGDAHV
jgi:hypothetical protein